MSLGDGHSANWELLVPLLIHPCKVAILEALAWIGRPLSASDLVKVTDHSRTVSFVTYHLKSLEKAQCIELVDSRRVRGATEKFYFFASADVQPLADARGSQ